jgi:hypothetical protein
MKYKVGIHLLYFRVFTLVISIVSSASWRKRSRLSTLAFVPEATPPPPALAPQSLSIAAVFPARVHLCAQEK